MATNVNNTTENQNIVEILNSFKTELMESILAQLNAQGATAPAKKSGGRKHYHKASEYTPTEGELNICEYSDKTVAIYGDLKDKTELLDIIKSFGSATIKTDKGNDRELRATFMRNLPSITLTDGTNPCGWLVTKDALDANGGMVALTDALAEAGAMVNTLDSVASITAARKAEKKSEPTAPSATKTKSEPKVEKTISTTNKTTAPASKPQTQVVSIAKTVSGVCYEPTKTGEMFRTETRTLTKTQGFYTLAVEGKGTVCYIYAGEDLETKDKMFLMVRKVKSVTDDVAASLNAIAKTNLADAVINCLVEADAPAMNVFARLGDADMVDFIWNKIVA